MRDWQSRLARSTPFYYGWVVFGAAVGVGYSSRGSNGGGHHVRFCRSDDSGVWLVAGFFLWGGELGWAGGGGGFAVGGAGNRPAGVWSGDCGGFGGVGLGVFWAGVCGAAVGFLLVVRTGAGGVCGAAGAGDGDGDQQLVHPAASPCVDAVDDFPGDGAGGVAVGGAVHHRRVGLADELGDVGHLRAGVGGGARAAADSPASRGRGIGGGPGGATGNNTPHADGGGPGRRGGRGQSGNGDGGGAAGRVGGELHGGGGRGGRGRSGCWRRSRRRGSWCRRGCRCTRCRTSSTRVCRRERRR